MNQMASLAGKVAIITGASSGIGASTAVLFSKLGASISLVGRNFENLKAVDSDCAKAGSQTLCVQVQLEYRFCVKFQLTLYNFEYVETRNLLYFIK
ncbi:putative oxidoreductase [Armadillidium nasatum]|uniref:Putative oxidoreductase n=1 Tax=Armadillidium nasatum TaxID=96803 RepID=A0A5N5T534_9CRUS|nr:putative oxidoreductase [Armadillidium nasatum]